MSKKRSIGKMIFQGVETNKIVSSNQQKAIARREKLVKELNRVIDNVDKAFSFEKVMLAKTALRRLYAQSHAIIEKPESNDKNSWRKEGRTMASGKEKAKRSPSQPRVEFSRKSK